MQLTLEQSIQIYVNRFKEVYASNKFKFTSKFPATCFNCGAIIYVPFSNATRKDIFCNSCRDLSDVQLDKRNPQLSYLNKIKEQQLPVIISAIPKNESIDLYGISAIKSRLNPKAKPLQLIDF